MRKSLLMVAMMLSGCGGTAPELYDLLVSYFTLPDSCYDNGMQPSSGQTAGPPALVQVQVWDGPDATPYLEVQGTGISIDMGESPTVAVSGIFTGKRGDKGWTFTSERVSKQTIVGNVLTSTRKIELTFERTPQLKGTASLSSSQACAGTNCPADASSSCAVSSIPFVGTQLKVDYERSP